MDYSTTKYELQQVRVGFSTVRELRELLEPRHTVTREVSDDGHKFRIVKRLDQLKVDAAVALSMACYRCLHLNIA